MSHILHAYEVIVRRRRDRQEQLLGNFDGAGADLLRVLEEFFRDPKMRDWLDPELNAAARVHEVYGSDPSFPDIIAAVVKSGEMGITSEIVSTIESELDDTVVFQRQREHAELVPVAVLAKLPGTLTKGFLVTHSPSGRGIKTKFWRALQEWFGRRFPNYVILLSPVYPSRFYRSVMEKEALKQVTLIRSSKPSDLAADDRRWFDQSTLGTVRTVITPRGRLHRLRKDDLLRVLERGEEISSLLVFRGETYEEIRTTFTDRNGRTHSIFLSEGGTRAPRAGYDVTDQLKLDQDGHPTYESLRQSMLQYIDLLVESAGGTT
jgi:hypothetical protein